MIINIIIFSKVTFVECSRNCSFIQVPLRAKLGEVIKGGGAEGGEGGRMWGLLEVTRIIGGDWGTLAAKLAVLQSVSRA